VCLRSSIQLFLDELRQLTKQQPQLICCMHLLDKQMRKRVNQLEVLPKRGALHRNLLQSLPRQLSFGADVDRAAFKPAEVARQLRCE
jgi:hypothetical protein